MYQHVTYLISQCYNAIVSELETSPYVFCRSLEPTSYTNELFCQESDPSNNYDVLYIMQPHHN